MSVAHTLPLLALTKPAKRQAQAASALIRLEGEPMMTQEPSTHAHGVEILSAKVSVLPASRRILLDFLEELFDPVRRSSFGLHRVTAKAWAISRNERIAC